MAPSAAAPARHHQQPCGGACDLDIPVGALGGVMAFASLLLLSSAKGHHNNHHNHNLCRVGAPHSANSTLLVLLVAPRPWMLSAIAARLPRCPLSLFRPPPRSAATVE